MSFRTALAVLWTILLLTACWLPDSALAVDEVPEAFSRLPHADKIVHFGLFGVFTVAWVDALSKRRRPWIALAAVVLAVTTELVQGLPIIHRDPGALDALADVVGMTAGLGFYALWERAGARFLSRTQPASLPLEGS